MSTKKIQLIGAINGGGGESGVGITSIEQTTTSTEDGGTNVVTVTLSDGTTATFEIKNGNKGSDGEKGDTGEAGPQGPQGEKGESGVYVGSGDMPDGYNIQIDPDGEADTMILPTITSDDEGKVVTVVDGAYVLKELTTYDNVEGVGF